MGKSLAVYGTKPMPALGSLRSAVAAPTQMAEAVVG